MQHERSTHLVYIYGESLQPRAFYYRFGLKLSCSATSDDKGKKKERKKGRDRSTWGCMPMDIHDHHQLATKI
jgi:hypothetical protein